MSEKKPDSLYVNRVRKPRALDEMTRVDDRRFTQKMAEVVQVAEDMRLKRMKEHRSRGFIALNFSILVVLVATGAFGWYFLMLLDIPKAIVCILAPIVVSILVYIWAARPIKNYKKEHKTIFMPMLAKALGGLTYYQERGINPKILERANVLPVHSAYKSEDCFMGMYKGVKVIFAEARLYSGSVKPSNKVFQGIFVLLETPDDVIEGHTIITADAKMAQASGNGRWKTMSPIFVSPANPDWDIFKVYATKPETAELMAGDRLLKELAEAAAIFNNAPLTAVLFGKRYVFVMIPNDKDMFEPTDLYMPMSTHQHAVHCKKEIEQILEIIDVFDLYKPIKTEDMVP